MLSVKVLGPGCARCAKLYTEAEKAVASSGVEVELTKVQDIGEIAEYGVAMTPALVVAEEVVSSGRIPRVADMVSWITAAAQQE
jgi:small redox-active disulfide protein 2